MGHKYTREQLLAAAVDAAIDDGLSALTFGRLAKRLGSSDRIVVYYFPSKHDLVGAVLSEVGTRLQGALVSAFPTRARDHVELARAAWPVLCRPEADPTFALFFEALGLAAAGTEPYRSVAAELLEAWASWLEGLLDGDARVRRAEAEAAIALLDGLLLLRQVAGPAAADAAASRILDGGGRSTGTSRRRRT